MASNPANDPVEDPASASKPSSVDSATSALEQIDKAIATSAINENVFNLAELHRLRGEYLVVCSEDRVSDAETSFATSLQVARSQKCKSSELRTLVSLYKLRQSQGHSAECHTALTEIYDWFNEGHELPDLIEVRKLLQR